MTRSPSYILLYFKSGPLDYDPVAQAWIARPGAVPAWLPLSEKLEGFDGGVGAASDSSEEEVEEVEEVEEERESSDAEISSSDDGELSESTSDGEFEETRSIALSSAGAGGVNVNATRRYDADGRRTGAAALVEPAFRVLQHAGLAHLFAVLEAEGYDTVSNLCAMTFADALAIGLERSDATRLVAALGDIARAAVSEKETRGGRGEEARAAAPRVASLSRAAPVPPSGAAPLPPLTLEETLGIGLADLPAAAPKPPRSAVTRDDGVLSELIDSLF